MTTDDGGWSLVAVADFQYSGTSGWNSGSAHVHGATPSNSIGQAFVPDMNGHWHLSNAQIRSISSGPTSTAHFRMNCFNSNNNFTRYWFGGPKDMFSWTNQPQRVESSNDLYNMTGASYPTAWASHHYGLVSGNTEANVMMPSHSGNHWACGGRDGPGGEGYTGRGGRSSFRLWAR